MYLHLDGFILTIVNKIINIKSPRYLYSMIFNQKQKEALMCLESGTKVTIDGKSAIVVATSGNRICATTICKDGINIPMVRDVTFIPPEKLLS